MNDEQTRDFKTHQEIHDGKQVRGMYSLSEPNGEIRVVTYTADATTGFRADVKRHPAGYQGPSNIFLNTATTAKSNPILSTEVNIFEKTSKPVENLILENPKNDSNLGKDSFSKQTHEKLMSTDPNLESAHIKAKPDIEDEINQLQRLQLTVGTPLQTYEMSSAKIQESPVESDNELLKPETNIDTSTFLPMVYNDNSQESTELYNGSAIQLSGETPAIEDNFTSTLGSLQSILVHEGLFEDHVKLENPTDSENTTQSKINLTNSMDHETNVGHRENIFITDSKLNTINIKETIKSTQVNEKRQNTSKEQMHGNINAVNSNELLNQISTNKHEVSLNQLNQGQQSLILTALVVPMSSVLTLTCLPTLQTNKETTVKHHNTKSQPAWNPFTSTLSTVRPIHYPSQLVGSGPLRNHQMVNSEANKQSSTSDPFSILGAYSQNQFLYRLPTATPHQMHPVIHTLADFTGIPTLKSGTTHVSLGIGEMSQHNIQYPIIRQTPHNPVPTQWKLHPTRTIHTLPHIRWPIYVLPMSHNSNFAVTFDPKHG